MTLFKKIIDREIPADIVYEDEKCLAFRDIEAQAPTHILLIPKKEIEGLSALESGDAQLMGHMMLVVPKIAKQEGIEESGYRIVCNKGTHGGQSVFHLHIHILGGRQLDWPPG